MAEGTVPNPNKFIFDYVIFNLNELTGIRGYIMKEYALGKNHSNEILVGFCLFSAGIEDVSYYQIQPINASADGVYLIYLKSSDVTHNRQIAMRLVFVKATDFV